MRCDAHRHQSRRNFIRAEGGFWYIDKIRPQRNLGIKRGRERQGLDSSFADSRRDISHNPGHAGTRSGVAYTEKPKLSGVSDTGRNARNRWRLAAVGAATFIVAGAILLVAYYGNPPISGAHQPTVATAVRDQSVFFVSDRDLDADATVDAKAALSRGEIPAVLENVPEGTRREIASGEQSIYSVRLMDFADEDGDAVKISLNDIPFGEVVLSNSGTKLAIPLKKGAQTKITCLASQDGQGGVTFRAVSSTGEMRTRVMAVGESESWTIAFK